MVTTPKALLVCLAFFGATGTALAADVPKDLKTGIQNVKTSCKDDIDKFCHDITQGDGRLAACLKSKEDKLSSDCNDSRKGLRTLVSEKMDRAELEVRKSCGGDIQKYCSDVPSGAGRIYECLGEHREALSDSCNALQAKLEDRLKKALG